MVFTKRIYTNTQKVFFYGSGMLGSFFLLLLTLSYLGIQVETSGDQVCEEKCVSYFNITLTNYSLCFGSTFKSLTTEPNVYTEIYKADLRYRRDNPLRWKSYNLTTGKCLEKNKKHEFMIIGYKNPSQIVKWGLDLQGKDVDPYWYPYQLDANLVNVTYENNFTHLNISTTAPYDSLVAYWNFDGDKENVNTTIYDWSKYNNDGQTFGGAKVNSTRCIYGDCLQLDGSGDYVRFTSVAQTQFTVSAWIYPTTAGNSVWPRIVDMPSIQFVPARSTGAYDDCLEVSSTHPTPGWWTSPVNSILFNQWYHVAFTYDGSSTSNNPLIYINGVSVTVSKQQTPSGSLPSNAGTGYIGDRAAGDRSFNGTIDDVMIFNTSLTSSQILAIYNNQSSRFAVSGKQEIYNQTYMNITSGNNRVNVTTYIENLLGSSINLTVGYYTGSWSYTAPQVISSGAIQTFNISSTSTNLTLNYTFYTGNSTNPFYSPILKDNITFTYWYEAVDTCTAPVSGNWAITCSDNCVWNTDQNIPANITMSGIGNLTLNANFTFIGIKQYIIQNSGCKFIINKGGFK